MKNEERSYLKNAIAELALYCKSRNIPAAFIFAENREGTKVPDTAYDKTIVTPLQCGIELHKDHITPLLAVGRGFTMVPTQFADDFYGFDDDAPEAGAKPAGDGKAGR